MGGGSRLSVVAVSDSSECGSSEWWQCMVSASGEWEVAVGFQWWQ